MKEEKTLTLPRDYLFDNIKAILIFLVVLGHFIEIGMYKSENFKQIWYAIYIFHMPLFIFISGYFTKHNKNNFRKSIKNFVIPYIIFDIGLHLFRVFILKEDVGNFKLLQPGYGLWFLVTMFIYKAIYNKVYKIKGIFTISIILALLVGFDKGFTNFLALSRTIVFFPFFIAGNKFKKENIIINSKHIKLLLTISIPIILFAISKIYITLDMPMDLLRCSVPCIYYLRLY